MGILFPDYVDPHTLVYRGLQTPTVTLNCSISAGGYGYSGSIYSGYTNCSRGSWALSWRELRAAYWKYLDAHAVALPLPEPRQTTSRHARPTPFNFKLPARADRLRSPLPSPRAQRQAVARLLRGA